MPEPKLELASKYLTAPPARRRLGLSRFQFDVRIERGIFPPPTFVDTVVVNGKDHHVRYFDENWVRIVKAILKTSPNLKRKRGIVERD